MSEPILSFLYNFSSQDLPYEGNGGEYGDWKEISLVSNGVLFPDKKIYTGGGINELLPVPTAPFGRREATLRPLNGTYVIPQVYIESQNDLLMYNVPLACNQPNVNRYVFAVYIDGTVTSDLYLEFWDDETLSTCNLPTLSGSSTYPFSVFNAISTTDSEPIENWSGSTVEGQEAGAVCLAGYENRLRLKGSDSIQNETLYYSMYAAIPFDLMLTHDTPVETYRYLYV